jgi:UDP-GlcNAc:undecaprenyl-phosphate GlcNAc-1-phosphate transferase
MAAAFGAAAPPSRGAAVSVYLLPAVFGLALLLAVYFTPLARQAALRFGIVDRPDGRLKQQPDPVPYLGGLAVFLAYLVALATVLEFNRVLLGLLLAGTLTLLVGLIDDFGVLTPLPKLVGLAVAVFVLLRSGAVIELTEVPQALRWPVAALWLLAVANAFNLLDVLDGLAAGVGAVGGAAMAVVAVHNGQLALAAAALALAGALCGFAVFNVHPARIYLGDAGSLAIGISLGAVALAIRWSDENPAGFLAPLVIFAVPLADTAYVSVLRARAGKPFWHGSPDHFPLRLRRVLGGRVRATVLICWALALLGAAIGVGAAVLWSWSLTLWTAGLYLAVILGGLLYLARVPMEEPQ